MTISTDFFLFKGMLKPSERGLECRGNVIAVNLDNLVCFVVHWTVFILLPDCSAYKMDTKKSSEKGVERKRNVIAVNLDNLVCFMGHSTVFLAFPDCSAYKMDTKKGSDAVSSLPRER
ncbi:unnamed protein product [Phyllotreta striolata]|uniref:Uncharacterized protein n=1 Tax=Phyllotreta striolata TaxID=444603 RepID=A0A9P0E0N1_PHYSR|nr:unnamed protein product [Phyllotreta striolata]